MKPYIHIIFLLLSLPSLSQSQLPVILANSKTVAIRDGDYFDKNAWSLSPKTRPDVYTTDRTRKTKWVIFYTDIDSIKVKVKPGSQFNFIVLLNGKDSCYTQINSAIPPEIKLGNHKNTHDTIPFNLTSYNAIHVQSVINDRDTLNLHFDLGSFDFHITKEAILKKTKLLTNQPEALAGKAIPNYNHLEKVFKIQIGNLVFNNPELMPTSLTAHEMDGRFGWNIFEGKVIELDFEKSLLIVHSSLPKGMHDYHRSNIHFIHSFLCVEAYLGTGLKKCKGNFLMDTGADQAMMLDSTWFHDQHIPMEFKLIKTTIFRDPRGQKFESKTVLSPFLFINGFPLTGIPTALLGSKNPTSLELNYFGNELLKRFNTIIDLKKDHIFLKANSLTNLPWKS
jgi:hypothetical protein